ncbi:MAG: hypothetical protein M3P33_02910, partial [bacterium]|nr:hypothetical protein [bacterium]
MHKRIADVHKNNLAGIRFSFTPFTHGWATQNNQFDRAEYIADMANALRTYRSYVEHIGAGKETACVEIRFKPHLEVFESDLVDTVINGRHCIRSGPYLLFSLEPASEIPESYVSTVVGGDMTLSQPGLRYGIFVSDTLITDISWQAMAVSISNTITPDCDISTLSEDHLHAMEVSFHKFSNIEGHYYVSNPDFHKNGKFDAIHFYPKTNIRLKSGYTNAKRFFLNSLLEYKYAHGIGRREEFSDATWDDVLGVVSLIRQKADNSKLYNNIQANYITSEVLPMMSAYVEILQLAEYPPSYFFSRNFTVDTGQIVNQGRALSQFQGLTSTPDLPMT